MNKTTGTKVIKLYLLFVSLFDQFVTFNSGLLKYTIRLEVVSTFLKQGKIVDQQFLQEPDLLLTVEILFFGSVINTSFKD